jgi:hypothetical protein
MTDEELRQKGREVIRLLDEICNEKDNPVIALQVLMGIAEVLALKTRMKRE